MIILKMWQQFLLYFFIIIISPPFYFEPTNVLITRFDETTKLNSLRMCYLTDDMYGKSLTLPKKNHHFY